MTVKLNKRGAMFGLDARITLVIASIIALAAGFSHIRKLDAAKIEATKYSLAQLKAASLKFYENSSSAGTSGYFADTIIELQSPDEFGQPFIDTEYTLDAWGNPFTFVTVVYCGFHVDTKQTSNLLYIFSAGPDGIFNYDYAGETGRGCDEFLPTLDALLAGDDLMIKVSSYELDRRFFAQANKQLAEIAEKITALAEHNRIRWQRICEAGGTGVNGCDYDDNGTYIKGEEQSMNFFPANRSAPGFIAGALPGCPVNRPFNADATSFSRSFISNSQSSMEALMTALGLPASYASLKGNVLKYDSNIDSRCSGPFNFKVWYY